MAKYQHVTNMEAALMKKMHEQGMGLRKIRSMTGRSFDTISKHVFKKNKVRKVNPKGRPPAISPSMFKLVWAAHEKLIKTNPNKEVTIKAVKANVGLTCSDRAVLDAFHKRGIYFRPCMRSWRSPVMM